MFDWSGLALGLGIGAVVGGLLAGGMLLVQLIPLEAIRSLNDRSTHQLMQLLRGLSVPQLIAVALTAGVGEELLFRGWLMQFLTGEMANCTQQEIFFGILVSSLVFGFAHPMSVSYVIVATLMGVILGTLYWYYDNLLVPIVAHWIYDAILMVWLTRMPMRATL
ncbi:MAG: CPBP family intramembrane glutamic endopeptidase [Pirellula sp.]